MSRPDVTCAETVKMSRVTRKPVIRSLHMINTPRCNKLHLLALKKKSFFPYVALKRRLWVHSLLVVPTIYALEQEQ